MTQNQETALGLRAAAVRLRHEADGVEIPLGVARTLYAVAEWLEHEADHADEAERRGAIYSASSPALRIARAPFGIG